MTNDRKSIIHPSISFISSGVASATSLFLASIGSLGIGSSSWLGRAVVAIASRWAPARRSRLLEPGTSRVRPTMSSKYRSCVPLGLISMSTTSSLPAANGLVESRFRTGGGTSGCDGEASVAGFHLSSWSIVVLKSQIGSASALHSLGQSLPPNVSRRNMISSLLSSSISTCVHDWSAVDGFRWHLR